MRRLGNLCGWVAMALILVSGLLTAIGWLPLGKIYFSVGVIGGACMVVHGVERQAWPVIGLNGIYAVINLVGFIRLLL